MNKEEKEKTDTHDKGNEIIKKQVLRNKFKLATWTTALVYGEHD